MKNRKQRNHKKLFIWIPLLALGLGGATGGGIAIAGYVFGVGPLAPAKTDIKTIFQNDTTHWKTADPAPTSGAYVWDSVFNTEPSGNDIIAFLSIYASTTTHANVVNQINVSSIGSTDNAWNTANIDANSKSREFTGAFTFYFKLNTSAQGNLANDLTNKNLDLSDAATGSENLDHDSLLQKLQDANSNLNVNAIEIVNTNSSTIYNGGFGINYADSLTNFWNISNDDYEQITIRGRTGTTYYGNQSVAGITLKLKRNELSAQTNWKSNWNNFNSFKTTPNNLDIQTAFDEAYDANAWYTHLAPTDTYADTWGFTIDSALGIFYIYGNPYWNSQNNQTASGAPTTYQFNYVLDTKILLSSQMINSSSTAITTLNFESDTNWATHPDQFNVDVYDALHNLVNASVWPNVAWLQIQLSFDSNAKTITLSPLATSTIYTSDTWTVNYTTIF